MIMFGMPNLTVGAQSKIFKKATTYDKLIDVKMAMDKAGIDPSDRAITLDPSVFNEEFLIKKELEEGVPKRVCMVYGFDVYCKKLSLEERVKVLEGLADV